MTKGRLLLIAIVVIAIAAYFYFDLGRYFSLPYIKAQQAAFAAYYAEHRLLTISVYFLIYVVTAALSLPVAVPLTLVGGAMFGTLTGTIIVSFASSIGATIAMVAARFVMRDFVQEKFGWKLARINEGIEKDGVFYLIALRLVPAVPFFVINLVMGLTRIRTWTYYWASQLGMLAGTIVYVNVGTQLARVDSFKGLLSPTLIVSFVVLGIFPLIAKKVVDAIKARRIYARWKRPAKFDYNLVVIGAGSAGLVSAYIAAAVKAKVALIEQHKMGGDCLNTGCVPSKALIRSARLLSQIARSQDFGVREARASFDFAEVMERVARVIRTIEPHDSVERYSALGVECVRGIARIVTPWTVEVDSEEGTRLFSTRSIVIAAGSRPLVPSIPGLNEVGYLTSDTVWNLRELPGRLLVLGGGPVGCELTQAFARFGARVTQVELLPRILMREDPDVSALVQRRFEAEGIRVLVNHTAKRFVTEADEKILIAENNGAEVRVPFDHVLVAVGRVANTMGYGLEQLGIALTEAKTIETDEYLQALYPNIYACGDVVGPYQFTHTASHQAWYAAVNALFGRFKRFKADYRVIPWATFTDPEVARVGINEQEATERGIAVTVTVYRIDDLDRAIADEEAHGLVKVLTEPGKDKILGATIAGEHAADLLAEYVLAMKHGIGLNKILGAIHTYPTLAEANKYAAGNWKRSTVTQGQWAFLAALQGWMRGEYGFVRVLGQLPALVRNKAKAYTPEAH